MKIQDITLDEFVLLYAMLITEKDILQFGLFLARGDSIDKASHHMAKGRTNVAIMELKRLGFIIEKHGTG